ncbi:hypothetical protein PR048_000010 [Dryococelus australis]|uniref:Uncharacterized protein n=1 Tax=Dryococelus australis TaxID=614101 RepID=A0ABQ9IDF6_9NEOP|nr:hypothetical protein PR048_000010 [Dryococelus australis]
MPCETSLCLSQTITTDTKKINIFLANVLDLPEVRQTFGKDCVTLEASSEKPEKNIQTEDAGTSYTVMATADPLSSVKAVEEVARSLPAVRKCSCRKSICLSLMGI